MVPRDIVSFECILRLAFCFLMYKCSVAIWLGIIIFISFSEIKLDNVLILIFLYFDTCREGMGGDSKGMRPEGCRLTGKVNRNRKRNTAPNENGCLTDGD